MIAAALLVVLFGSGFHCIHARPTQQPGAAATPVGVECVTFETARPLSVGESFTAPIGKGLEFRLAAEGAGTWLITVGPKGTKHDYLWVVSPPFRTAPHLQIGRGYNPSATQSAQMSPRSFRFVTTSQEYDDAARVADRATRDADAAITVRDIQRQGKGSLELWMTGFGTAKTDDVLTWIRVRRRACQPR